VHTEFFESHVVPSSEEGSQEEQIQHYERRPELKLKDDLERLPAELPKGVFKAAQVPQDQCS